MSINQPLTTTKNDNLGNVRRVQISCLKAVNHALIGLAHTGLGADTFKKKLAQQVTCSLGQDWEIWW